MAGLSNSPLYTFTSVDGNADINPTSFIIPFDEVVTKMVTFTPHSGFYINSIYSYSDPHMQPTEYGPYPTGQTVYRSWTSPNCGSTCTGYDMDYFVVCAPLVVTPAITFITPNSGPNTGNLATIITGTNFVTGASVYLTRASQTDITATNVVVTPPNTITCTLPITGVAVGEWNVVVTNPDSSSDTLENGFYIHSLNCDFTYWPTTGVAPLTIHFTDTSSGSPTPTEWNWDFTNDGNPDASGRSVCWTFTSPGTYYVNLTVGSGIETATIQTAIGADPGMLIPKNQDFSSGITSPVRQVVTGGEGIVQGMMAE